MDRLDIRIMYQPAVKRMKPTDTSDSDRVRRDTY